MAKCSIERVNNGFILKEVPESEEEQGRTIIFEDGEITTNTIFNSSGFEEEIIPLQKLFFTVMDFFGLYNSKNEKKALDISIVDRKDFPVEDTIKDLKDENERLRERIKDIMEENAVNKCQNFYTDKSLCICDDEE
jgi:hypothetical protein